MLVLFIGLNILKFAHYADFCPVFKFGYVEKLCSDFLIDDNELSIIFDRLLGDEKTLKSYLEAIVSTSKIFIR